VYLLSAVKTEVINLWSGVFNAISLRIRRTTSPSEGDGLDLDLGFFTVVGFPTSEWSTIADAVVNCASSEVIPENSVKREDIWEVRSFTVDSRRALASRREEFS
jgi:hypothetical protein